MSERSDEWTRHRTEKSAEATTAPQPTHRTKGANHGAFADAPHFIYALVNPRNHFPFYVGMTNSIEQRFEQHIESSDGKKRASIIKGLADAGLQPAIIVLERKPNRKAAKYAEVFWIELFSARGIPIANKHVQGGIDVVAFHLSAPLAPRHPEKLPNAGPSEDATDALFRQNHHRGGPLPANHGKPWTELQCEQLVAEFESGATIDALATQHARTYYGILGQLRRVASSRSSVYEKLANLGLLKSQESSRQLGNPPSFDVTRDD